MKAMRKLALPNGDAVPALGQGTWKMGESRSRRKDEVAALSLGLELGMTLIDTAEMYGNGGAEEIIAEVIKGRRREVFLVSKVYPHNASRAGVVAACERSLKRLKTDRLDLYLLHWRGGIALAWVLRQPQVLTIPKASKLEHVRENRAAADIELTGQDLADLDAASPPPRRAAPLEMN